VLFGFRARFKESEVLRGVCSQLQLRSCPTNASNILATNYTSRPGHPTIKAGVLSSQQILLRGSGVQDRYKGRTRPPRRKTSKTSPAGMLTGGRRRAPQSDRHRHISTSSSGRSGALSSPSESCFSAMPAKLGSLMRNTCRALESQGEMDA